MKKYIFFEELIWNLTEKVEVYDTEGNKLCSKNLPSYYRRNKKFANRIVWNIEPYFKNDGRFLKFWYRVIIRTENNDKYQRENMANDMIDLLETLAKDDEQNGDGKGVYYYRSLIPFIKTYYGIKEILK